MTAAPAVAAPMTKQPAVYILAGRRYGTLYIGVTSQLAGRVWQHKHDTGRRHSRPPSESAASPPRKRGSSENPGARRP